MTVTATHVSVKFVVVSAKGSLVTKTKAFATQSAMATFLDRLEAAGELHQVLGFRDES